MVDVPAIRCGLIKTVRSVRAVIRSLGSGRETQDAFSQKALLLLGDILDVLYQIQEQLSWSNEKWVSGQLRLNALDELISSFDSTIEGLDAIFQSGGVGSRLYKKALLERTFLARLELYKSAFVVAMQPETQEKAFVEQQLKSRIRTSLSLSYSPKPSSQLEEDFHTVTSVSTSRSFMTLGAMCNERHKGTCQWIFNEEKYKLWLFGCLRTLYCIAPAGTGKTFLASSIVENLQNTFASSDVAIVFLFLQDEKQDDSVSSITMLANVLAQLVYRRRSASNTTASLYRSECFANGKASAKRYQDAIRAEINHFSKVFFVIDGLDGFHEKDRILNRFQKLPDHAQLLITLREMKHGSQDDFLPVLTPRSDLERYVHLRISQDAGLTSLLKLFTLKDKLKEAIAQQVAKKSHGLFLLARLHMDLVTRCKDGNLLERALLHLPESLNDTYAESMKQLASQNLYASRCIFWTLYACRPLSVAELKSAVFFEPQNGAAAQKEGDSFEQILHVETAGLLRVDPMTGTVHLVHKTAKEYLTGAAARVFFPTAKKHIAETCLTVITSDEVVDDCYINHGTTPRNMGNSLLSYAATYWGQHAREAPEDEQTTQVLIRAFLNKLCWRRPPANNEYTAEELKIPSILGLGKYFSDWGALHVLAYFGVIEKAQRMIEKGDDINARDNCMGVTPLHCAAHRGHEEMVEMLLDHKADINATCDNGNTAMHYAAEQGQRKIMRILLGRRANSRTANRQGVTALQLAVGTAYDEATVPMLVRSRSDMDAQNALTGNTALHVAVETRRARILLFLLDKGANMNIFNKQGLTPLQLAAKIGNFEAISALLERGAKIELCSILGLTALHIAAQGGKWVAFDLLLISGADINAWQGNGETLLHEQARSASNVSIAAHLLSQGANIEARTAQGYTSLQCAAMSGNKTMFLFLQDNGAKVDVQTPKGESLLHITPPSSQDCLDILTNLVNCGLNVNAICTNGWTPLLQTVYTGTGAPDIEFDKTSEYIELLLSQGADLNARSASSTGDTALHLATIATLPRPSLVKFLVDRGASVNSKTAEGKTPLHLAAERGRDSIFQVLLSAGADLTLKIPNSATTSCDDGDDAGETPLDLARKHPIGALWFDERGNLQLSVGHEEEDLATPTTIDIDTDSGTDDETGGSTLVEDEGSQWGSVTSSQVVSIID